MRILRLLILPLLFCSLQSCEGAFNIHGHVYDKTTKQALDSVQVILIIGKYDTIWKCQPPATIDNQNDLDRDKYQLAFTDTVGYFSISSGLIGMGPGELKTKVVFTKRGYATVTVTTGEQSKLDSVQMQQLQ